MAGVADSARLLRLLPVCCEDGLLGRVERYAALELLDALLRKIEAFRERIIANPNGAIVFRFDGGQRIGRSFADKQIGLSGNKPIEHLPVVVRPFAEQGAIRIVLAFRHDRLNDFVGIDVVGLSNAALPTLVGLASNDGPLTTAADSCVVGFLDNDDRCAFFGCSACSASAGCAAAHDDHIGCQLLFDVGGVGGFGWKPCEFAICLSIANVQRLSGLGEGIVPVALILGCVSVGLWRASSEKACAHSRYGEGSQSGALEKTAPRKLLLFHVSPPLLCCDPQRRGALKSHRGFAHRGLWERLVGSTMPIIGNFRAKMNKRFG